MKILKWLFEALLWLVATVKRVSDRCLRCSPRDQWRDEPTPSQAAMQLADAYRNRPTVTDADNAYVYAVGLAASPEEDPQAWAETRMARVRVALEQETGPAAIA